MKSHAILRIVGSLFALAFFSHCRRSENRAASALPETAPASATQRKEVRPQVGSELPKTNENLNNGTPAPKKVTVQQMRLVMQNRSFKTAMEGEATMKAFLADWHPVGRSAAEIKDTFGPPDAESERAIYYKFDAGFDGTYFVFALVNGKVVKVATLGLE